MNCVISSINAKIFAKAIIALSKIGTELFVECDYDGLFLRTVNSTNSAFAVFKFYPNFFSEFNLKVTPNCNKSKKKCKISLKAFLWVFKSMKRVEMCKLKINLKKLKFIIELKCRLETTKTYNISIIDTQSLKVLYFIDTTPNKILASFRLFIDMINNFQMLGEEITIMVNRDNLVVKNYVEKCFLDTKFMRSQLILKCTEFERYQINEETSITFCLREFKALLSFAESMNLDIALYFDTAGHPIALVVQNTLFEVNLVLSSLPPDDIFLNDPLSSRNLINTTAVKTKCESINVGVMENLKKKRFSDFVAVNSSKGLSELWNTSVSSCRCSTGNERCIGNKKGKTNFGEIGEPGRILMTFRDTEDINNMREDCGLQFFSSAKKVRAQKIFKRCFEPVMSSNTKALPSHILAQNSDTED